MTKTYLIGVLILLTYSVNATTYTVCTSGDWDNNSAQTSVRFNDGGGCSINPFDITWAANDEIVVPVGFYLIMNSNKTIGPVVSVDVSGEIWFDNGKLVLTDIASTLELQVGSHLYCGTYPTIDPTCPTNDQVTIGGNQFSGSELDDIEDADRPSTVTNTGLPIYLLSFNAFSNENTLMLTWTTASEENNDYFTLERSSNGLNFHEFTRLDVDVNSFVTLNYSYAYTNPFQVVSYYILKQTDYDGTNETFKVIAAEYYGESTPVKIIQVPNQLLIYNNMDEENLAYLYDMAGRGGEVGILKVGENNISSDKFNIHSGMYILKVVNSLGKVLTSQKFVVQ